MIVKCINNDNMIGQLTIGEEYIIEQEFERYYRVKISKTTSGNFLKSRFKEVTK